MKENTMQINVTVEKKVGKEWKEVEAPVSNWGVRSTDLPLLSALAGIPYDRKNPTPLTIEKTVKELMQHPIWSETRDRTNIIPAWYYLYWREEMKPAGRPINVERAIKIKTPEGEKTSFTYDKGKKTELFVLTEEEFTKRLRSHKQLAKNYDNNHWVDLLQKKTAWKKMYVWVDWQLCANQYGPYQAFWSGPLCWMANAASYELSKIRVKIEVAPKVEAPVQAPAEPTGVEAEGVAAEQKAA
jgi:hypothetical protein